MQSSHAHPMTRTTRWVTAAVACGVLLGAGCGSEDDGGAITAPEGEGTTATTAAPDTTGTTATTAAPPTGADEGAATEDGEHVVFLTGLDVEGRTITFDVVQ